LGSLRRFYTDDGGYAIAKQTDLDCIYELLDAGFNSLVVDGTTGNIDSTSTLTQVYEGDGTTWDQTTATDISDAGIRTYVKALDDNDTPMQDRVMVVPTIVKFDLLGLARFTEQAYTGEVAGGNTIRSGLVGNIYGMPVFVSTNLPLVEDSLGTADNACGLVFHKDSAVLVEQMGVRSQSQYKQEYLADLFTVDAIYGVQNLRTGSIVNFVVPST